MSKKPYISIVSPEYKGEKMVSELVSRIIASVTPITENFEIILVNDASPDNTWKEIRKQCDLDPRVKGLNLSHNFGENYAISAGMAYATGDWIVELDCDLQNMPEDIPLLYNKALEGYDIVYAQRVEKRFGFFKKLSSVLYHGVLQWLSGAKQDSSIAEFGIYSSRVIDEYNKLPEVARSFANLITSVGFRSTAIPVHHADRAEGKTSYTFSKLLKVASDVILSNSNKPLKIAVKTGALIVFVAFLLVIWTIVEYYVHPGQPQGFSSTFISIWFLGGLNIMFLGIVGLYIGKIFDQVKGRPLYIVADTENIEKKSGK